MWNLYPNENILQKISQNKDIFQQQKEPWQSLSPIHGTIRFTKRKFSSWRKIFPGGNIKLWEGIKNTIENKYVYKYFKYWPFKTKIRKDLWEHNNVEVKL